MATLEISDAWLVVAASSVVITIAATALGIRKYIEDRIKDALSKEEVLRAISLRVKPDLIFDDQEAILSDRGAAAFLKEHAIHIKRSTVFGDKTLPTEIRIEFNKYLTVAPLLTPLNADAETVSASHGKDCDWIYILDYSMAGGDDSYVRKYRLEMFQPHANAA